MAGPTTFRPWCSVTATWGAILRIAVASMTAYRTPPVEAFWQTIPRSILALPASSGRSTGPIDPVAQPGGRGAGRYQIGRRPTSGAARIACRAGGKLALFRRVAPAIRPP